MDQELQTLARLSTRLYLGRLLRLGLINFVDPETIVLDREVCVRAVAQARHRLVGICGHCVMRQVKLLRTLR